MKIEFDIPEFKRELKIEITLKRDGEVIYTETKSQKTEETSDDNKVDNKTSSVSSIPDIPKNSTPGKKDIAKRGKGNMMNIEEL